MVTSKPDGEAVTVFVRVRPLKTEENQGGPFQNLEGQRSVERLDEQSVLVTPPGENAEDGEIDVVRNLSVSQVDQGACPRTPAKAPSAGILRTPGGLRKLRTPWRTPARLTPKTFSFDRVFAEDATQEEVYRYAQPLLEAALKGYNATVLAYGSTGSGKTHTIIGSENNPGIAPRAIQDIFSHIQGSADNQFAVKMTFVELYNNTFRDLLDVNPSSMSSAISSNNEKKAAIQIHESKKDGVFLSGGPTLVTMIDSAEQAMQLLKRGLDSRAVGKTLLNDQSSRSHLILILYLESSVNGLTRRGKLNIVDLAGSERLSMSGAEGEAMTETQAINLSLTALSNVLSHLSRPREDLWLVPYRNSKLTHLLKDSLGGTAKTLMITHVRPTKQHYRQTLVALDYTSRAKFIKNKAEINFQLQDDANLEEAVRERDALKELLKEKEEESKVQQSRLADIVQENDRLRYELKLVTESGEKERKRLAQALRAQEMLTDPQIYEKSNQLASEVSSLQQEKEQLQKRLKELRDEKDRSQKELEAELKRKTDEVNTLTLQHEKEEERRKDELRRRAEEEKRKEEEALELNIQTCDLRLSLYDQEREQLRSQARMVALEEETLALKSELLERKERSQMAEKERDLEREREEKEMERMQKKHQELEKTLAKLEEQFVQREESLYQQLDTAKARAKAAEEALRKAKTSADSTSAAVQAEKSELQKKLGDLQRKMTEQGHRVKEQEKAFKELEKREKELEKTIKDVQRREQEVEKTAKELEKREKEAEKKGKEMEKAAKELEKREKEAGKARKQLERTAAKATSQEIETTEKDSSLRASSTSPQVLPETSTRASKPKKAAVKNKQPSPVIYEDKKVVEKRKQVQEEESENPADEEEEEASAPAPKKRVATAAAKPKAKKAKTALDEDDKENMSAPPSSQQVKEPVVQKTRKLFSGKEDMAPLSVSSFNNLALPPKKTVLPLGLKPNLNVGSTSLFSAFTDKGFSMPKLKSGVNLAALGRR